MIIPITKKQYGKQEKLTERGREIQIDFRRKLHNKNAHEDVQISIVVNRKYWEINYLKNNKQKISFGFTISDREENNAGTDTES